jgi:hypothetical protein
LQVTGDRFLAQDLDFGDARPIEEAEELTNPISKMPWAVIEKL